MSLLDDLRAAAPAVDSQFQVTSNEVPGVLSALIYYQEHGQAFLDAAQEGTDAVTELLAPAPAVAQEPAPASESSDLSDADLQARISDLEAQLASRRATSQQTQVEHEAGVA